MGESHMKNHFSSLMCAVLAVIILMIATGCGISGKDIIAVRGKSIHIEFDRNLGSRIVAVGTGVRSMGPFRASEYIVTGDSMVTWFSVDQHVNSLIHDEIGTGRQTILTGSNANWQKTVTVTAYDDFPAMLVFDVVYQNTGENPQFVKSWVNNHYSLSGQAAGQDTVIFWSYQSGSYEDRRDWVRPLYHGFVQENFMGMNATDYGGGTPVVDVWHRHSGIGVGHVETKVKLVSLPVEMPSETEATLGVRYDINQTVKPGETFQTFRTFVAVHTGDYFATLINYARFMGKLGLRMPDYPETCYEPIWCAWGFRRDFTIDQIYGALPKARDLGFEWAVLDDGYQTAEGDWYLIRDKFPQGDQSMRDLVDEIHRLGMKAKLWWVPMAVDPGTDLIKKHPEYLLLNADGSRQDISWWDAYYLCPAYSGVQEYTRNMVVKIMKTWGYDGLKIDGQHLNGAPPCFNPAHHHARPEESVEGVADLFRVFYETAMEINPEAVVEVCPCGTAYAFHSMPYMNQAVASDPESSWQIRHKGKTLKALMGVDFPYYGDHVELSDGGNDFASTVGIGGVVGSKFTWPVGVKQNSRVDLTPEKEKIWAKWIRIYKEKMLSKGLYRGELYDIGFDRPETHAVQKDGRMFYAFYDDVFEGSVTLRGLDPVSYQVTDYVDGRDLGTVKGPEGKLKVAFRQFLLVEAVPVGQ